MSNLAMLKHSLEPLFTVHESIERVIESERVGEYKDNILLGPINQLHSYQAPLLSPHGEGP